MADITIQGSSAFRFIDVTLYPGESIIAEAGSMSSMSPRLDLHARLNGGLLKALARHFLGHESVFINTFSNPTAEPQYLILTTQAPGDVRALELKGETMYLQSGAYICSTPGVQVKLSWAGFRSALAGEGLFRLAVSGEGTVWYGGYGQIVERLIDGAFIVDSSHLIAYEPTVELHVQLANGIFGSFFGGEGLVTRLEGKGRIFLQTRSVENLAKFLKTMM